jgi:hypothetical protein
VGCIFRLGGVLTLAERVEKSLRDTRFAFLVGFLVGFLGGVWSAFVESGALVGTILVG